MFKAHYQLNNNDVADDEHCTDNEVVAIRLESSRVLVTQTIVNQCQFEYANEWMTHNLMLIKEYR